MKLKLRCILENLFSYSLNSYGKYSRKESNYLDVTEKKQDLQKNMDAGLSIFWDKKEILNSDILFLD